VPKTVSNAQDPEPARRLSAPKALVGVILALVLLHALIVASWMIGLTLNGGSRAMWRTYGEYGNPYNHLYRGAVDRLAAYLVPPARPGEAIAPQIRYESPWPQGLALLIGAASLAWIAWLYRREGTAPAGYRALLAGLRIGLVLLAMFMLSEAVLSVDRTGLPYFVILADNSASAGVADAYADPKAKQNAAELARVVGQPEASRLAVAQGWLARDDAAFLRALQKQHKVRIEAVSATVGSVAQIDAPDQVAPAVDLLKKVEPLGGQSRLGDGLRQVLTELRGVPPTAILLLSDGQTTDGEALAKAAEFAKAKGVPLYTVGLGDPAPTRDLELSDLMVDEVVFVDDQVRFEARLSGHGFAGQQVDVRLRRRPAGIKDPRLGEEVGRATVPVPPDGQTARVEVRHEPKDTGEFVYSLEIEPRPRELQAENNRVERQVDVREEKLRVLMVEGQPRYEFRYLLSFLKRDKTIDLKAVLQSADPEFSEQEVTALPTFPATKDGPDGLFSFDVVLFGDVDSSLLNASQMLALADFVQKKGGGLMFIAGELFDPLSYRGTPLEPLLPIKLAEAINPSASGAAVPGFRPELSVEGRSHPIFRLADDEAASAQVWKDLPMLDWFLQVPRKQELAFVLATHPEQAGSDGPLPLLLYQFVGTGKVVFQAYDETWKWRFRVGDRYFGRYWIQMVRFLARSKLLGQKQAEVATDRRRYQRQQPVRFQVRFPNPGLAPTSGELSVQVDRKGQPPRRVPLKRSPSAQNLFEGALPPLPEGEYEVRLLPPPILEGGMPGTAFRVDPPAGEFEHVQMNEPELVRAASLTGGRFLTPARPATDLLKDLPAPQMVPLDTDPPIPLWNSPALLGLFLAMLVAEWVLRKRKQMV
jgi:hypothetical protein